METKIKVAAESSTTEFPTIMVEQIMEPKSGSGNGKNLLVRWVTQPRVTEGGGLLGLFLGPLSKRNDEQRVALQFFANEFIDELKLDIGSNFNEAMKAAGHPMTRLTVLEITKKDFYALDEKARINFSPKMNPSTGEMLCIKGQPIYRKVFIDTVSGEDVYLAHDGSADSSEEPTV